MLFSNAIFSHFATLNQFTHFQIHVLAYFFNRQTDIHIQCIFRKQLNSLSDVDLRKFTQIKLSRKKNHHFYSIRHRNDTRSAITTRETFDSSKKGNPHHPRGKHSDHVKEANIPGAVCPSLPLSLSETRKRNRPTDRPAARPPLFLHPPQYTHNIFVEHVSKLNMRSVHSSALPNGVKIFAEIHGQLACR